MESATDPLLYELDARGDITLTLNESTLEYEDDEDFFMAPALPASPYEIQRKRKRATLDLSRRLEGLPASSPLGLNLTMYGDDQPAEDPIYTQEPPAKGDEDKESVIQEDHASKPLPIRFLVSSKHLTLASPLFAAMLKPTWAEGAALYSQGTAVIPALSSSRDSLLLFLNVIHCRSRLIPQSIDIGQLCEIAQLADYYQSNDAFQFHFETWTQNSGNQPSELTRDSVRWLYISWVLKKRDLFTRVARVLHREAKAPLRVSKLSIPDTVIGEVKRPVIFPYQC
ncbi:hypothetical protein MGYG_01682 [Nannizzia gypsea CBS 118893]|uniref:BTB domain-containing protein n=1 Tax=Arthroderma gypseum (strain ATCC MYA-4604 / CBS 118893) TaxID=535722 RepID=E5R2K3_ARTGP|nr:hypothetical protein MGYG_01682 [Nannizzia gypsea CBS 118893]EFQ98661.1 hypothetical protein MGYG_01682 [Nannizzia gypsea CBS 118893]